METRKEKFPVEVSWLFGAANNLAHPCPAAASEGRSVLAGHCAISHAAGEKCY